MRYVYLAVTALLLLTPFAMARATVLAVDDSWVREGPETARLLPAFMTLRNAGPRQVTITAVTCPLCRAVVLQRTVLTGGLLHSVPHGDLTVAPGTTHTLVPGGDHLSLLDPIRPLRAGAIVPLTLHFADGRRQTVRAPVRAGEPARLPT